MMDLSGQMICSSNADANVKVEGVIEGVREFSNTYESRNSVRNVLFLLAVYILVFAIILFVVFNLFDLKAEGKGKDKQKTLSERLTTRYQLVIRNEDNWAEKSTLGFTYVKVLVISVSMFVVIFIASLFLSRTLFRLWFEPIHKNKVKVPLSILP